MSKLLWRGYFKGGSVFDNRVGSWNEAPLDGWQAVAVEDEKWGRLVYYGNEHYVPAILGNHRSIYGTDDLTRHLREHCPWIKYGTSTSREEFEELVQRAMNDPDFPMKSPRRRSTDWKA